MSYYTRKHQMPKLSKLRGRCPEGKLRYPDAKLAIRALHRMQNTAALAIELTGSTGRLEKRYYHCGLCKGIHLTKQDLRSTLKEAA
jgi:hypothetical protein